MATITAGNFSINFDQLDVTSFLLGTVTVSAAGQFSTTDSGITDSFFGNFTYAGGHLTGGVMFRLQEIYLVRSSSTSPGSICRSAPSCYGLRPAMMPRPVPISSPVPIPWPGRALAT